MLPGNRRAEAPINRRVESCTGSLATRCSAWRCDHSRMAELRDVAYASGEHADAQFQQQGAQQIICA